MYFFFLFALLAANSMTLAQIDALRAAFEADFSLIPESHAIFPAWKTLVHAAGILGKQVHDARLVAVCQVAGVQNILTFNTGHFMRLAACVPGLAILHPATV